MSVALSRAMSIGKNFLGGRGGGYGSYSNSNSNTGSVLWYDDRKGGRGVLHRPLQDKSDHDHNDHLLPLLFPSLCFPYRRQSSLLYTGFHARGSLNQKQYFETYSFFRFCTLIAFCELYGYCKLLFCFYHTSNLSNYENGL